MSPTKNSSAAPKQLQDFDMVLFGGTGDLAMRKLLPALFRRFLAGQFPARARIISVARSSIERDDYLAYSLMRLFGGGRPTNEVAVFAQSRA